MSRGFGGLISQEIFVMTETSTLTIGTVAMPRTRAPDWKYDWKLHAWALYWCIHIGIWGFWGWKESELFLGSVLAPNGPWWFDFAGHAWAGVLGSINDLYLYSRRRSGGLQEVRRDMGDLHLTKCVVADVALAGIVWEGIERIWDWLLQPNFATWAAKAQKDVVDNMIDLFTNPSFALATLLLFFMASAIFNRWIKKQANKDEELAAEIAEIAEKVDSLEGQLALCMRNLKQTKRELIVEYIRKRKGRIRMFLREGRKTE